MEANTLGSNSSPTSYQLTPGDLSHMVRIATEPVPHLVGVGIPLVTILKPLEEYLAHGGPRERWQGPLMLVSHARMDTMPSLSSVNSHERENVLFHRFHMLLNY